MQGTLSEIKERDPVLYAEWQAIMTKKEAEIDNKAQSRSGKERWALLKHVSKIGLQLRNKSIDTSWKQNDYVRIYILCFIEWYLTVIFFRLNPLLIPIGKG